MLRRLPEVAKAIGVSYPTLKQWIYRGWIRSTRTAGGHYRIPDEELKRFLRPSSSSSRALQSFGRDRPTARKGRSPSSRPRPSPLRMTGALRISGRNKITGTVKEIELDGLLARVVLSIGRQTITAIITREACLELDLEVGDRAAALVKATEVMILKSEPKG